jgi:hypothetical protein
MPLTFRLPNLVMLNGVELTDENRNPLQETRDERSVVIELATGKKRKFIKSIARKWEISWDNVAESASNTIDGFAGRDEIRTIAQSGETMTLVLTDGRTSTETYTVFVDDYNEELLMRRNGHFRYKISLSLEEQQ